MKMRHWIMIVFVASLGYFIYNTEEKSDALEEIKNTPLRTERKPNAIPEPTPVQALPNATKLTEEVAKKIPTHAPRELKERWSHKSNFEDADYIDTQLHLDGKPIDGYFFKWSKDDKGGIAELVAGTMPEVDRVNGSFPSAGEFQQIVNSVVDSDTQVLSTQEVWNLNSHRVLTPQAKVEVQTKSRSQRSAGHEYWFINLNSGKIVKRVEADRN